MDIEVMESDKKTEELQRKLYEWIVTLCRSMDTRSVPYPLLRVSIDSHVDFQPHQTSYIEDENLLHILRADTNLFLVTAGDPPRITPTPPSPDDAAFRDTLSILTEHTNSRNNEHSSTRGNSSWPEIDKSFREPVIENQEQPRDEVEFTEKTLCDEIIKILHTRVKVPVRSLSCFLGQHCKNVQMILEKYKATVRSTAASTESSSVPGSSSSIASSTATKFNYHKAIVNFLLKYGSIFSVDQAGSHDKKFSSGSPLPYEAYLIVQLKQAKQPDPVHITEDPRLCEGLFVHPGPTDNKLIHFIYNFIKTGPTDCLRLEGAIGAKYSKVGRKPKRPRQKNVDQLTEYLEAHPHRYRVDRTNHTVELIRQRGANITRNAGDGSLIGNRRRYNSVSFRKELPHDKRSDKEFTFDAVREPVLLVLTLDGCKQAVESFSHKDFGPIAQEGETGADERGRFLPVVCCDCEFAQLPPGAGGDGSNRLMTIQMVAKDRSPIYVFDIRSSPDLLVDGGLKDLLESPNIVKVFHDCIQDVKVISQYSVKMRNVMDTQILHRVLTGQKSASLAKLVQYWKIPFDKNDVTDKKDWHRTQLSKTSSFWAQNLTNDMIEYCATDAAICKLLYVIMGRNSKEHHFAQARDEVEAILNRFNE